MVALAIVDVLGTWRSQADALDDRYREGSSDLDLAFAFFAPTAHLRIAVGGFAGDHPLCCRALSNRIDFVGVTVPYGGFRPASSCAEWRRLFVAGDFDDVVVSRLPVARQRVLEQVASTEAEPAARLVLHRVVTSVFRLVDQLDPASCPA